MAPETLRLYASIFEKPQREVRGGLLRPPSGLCLAAAAALRMQANIAESEPAIAQYYRGRPVDAGCDLV